MLVSVVSGVILAVVGVIGARVFLEWMNTPKEVIDLSSLSICGFTSRACRPT